MRIKDISTPEVYKESSDFRFFLDWFDKCLHRIQFDIENMIDIYDPLRCPKNLLWMLADTIGFKYDGRLPASYNRLVLVYFMSMIRLKGSKDGMTLAAETNLAQFNILRKAVTGYKDHGGKFIPPKEILSNRLEDTSIPVNSAYVTPHVEEGYIDVVYFSDKTPIDACIEYVRPLGMYVFQTPGVRFDARTKVTVDARLTNSADVGLSFGPTQVGHYRRDDYARMQHMSNEQRQKVNTADKRKPVYYRNKTSEGTTSSSVNPGYRALYSLQLCNNEEIVESLIEPFFSIGTGPLDVSTRYPDNYLTIPEKHKWNLRYDKAAEERISDEITTIDDKRTKDILTPRPAVNPIMRTIGDSISLNDDNTSYSKIDKNGYPQKDNPTK